MATTGDGYESDIVGEKPRKRPFRPEINEEAQNVSEEAGQNNSTQLFDEGGNSAAIEILKREQLQKQKTFTSSEIQHPTTMENLPADLLSNIFIRLLAKQLAQMRSVSKSWNALLSQSSFVKSHLHHSIYNNDRILVVFYSETTKPFTAHPFESHHLELTNFIRLPPVDPNSGSTTSMIKVIGSIHGLICSTYSDGIIQIWNPSLSAMLTLPPHYIPSRGSYEIYFRFGFDPKTDDYKVLKLIGLTGPPKSGTLAFAVKEWLQAEIYSMRKGSWEFITQRFPPHVTTIFKDDYVCADGHDGHLHWHAYIDEEGNRQTIVAFDLSSETFCEIPFLDSVLNGKHSNLLGVLGGKLCVMSTYEGDDGCELWVMDEYGVAESWVKHLVRSHFLDGVGYGFTSHNEFLVVDDDCYLVLYDPSLDDANILENFCLGKYSPNKIVEYVDSLVWVAPAKYEMVDGGRRN